MSFRLFAEGTPWTVSGLPRCHTCSSEEATFRPSCSKSENPRATHLVPRWLPSQRFRFEKVRLAIVAVLCRVGVVLDSTRPREELWELEEGAEQRPDLPHPRCGWAPLPTASLLTSSSQRQRVQTSPRPPWQSPRPLLQEASKGLSSSSGHTSPPTPRPRCCSGFSTE